MKSFAITALLSSSTMAIRLDEPTDINYKDVWGFNKESPAAMGFVETSSCLTSGHNGMGVSCVPNHQLFATGMNGDEDLGEDIIMKGKPFHYNQKKAKEDPAGGKPAGYDAVSDEAEKVHVLQTPNAGYRTTYYNKKDSKFTNMAQLGSKPPGYESVSDEAEKVHVLQTPNAGYRTTFYAQSEEKPAGYEPVSDEAEKVHVLQTPNAGYRTTYYLGKDSKMINMAQTEEKPAGYEPVSDEAEKVHVLQTPNAGYRTTFYAQSEEKPAGYESVSDEAEKVHVLQTPNAGYRTTFYLGKDSKMINKLSQEDPEPAPATSVQPGPEKVSVLETPIAKTHTTFYNQQGNAPTEAAPKKKKADPVSPETMDPWVYKMSKENSGVFPNTHGVDTTTGVAGSSFVGKASKELTLQPEYYF